MKLFAAAALLMLAASAQAEPLIVDNGRLFLSAKVNGIATEALLDSGAEASLVDPELALAARFPEGETIQIKGSGGEAPARIVPGVKIEALGLAIEPEIIVVMDLAELSERLIKRPTQAIVGRELFDSARLRIDIGAGKIEAIPADSQPPGHRLLLTAHAGIESIPVKANGIAAQAEFDLGNGSGVLVSRAMADKLGLRLTGETKGGGIGGEVRRDKAVLDRLDVAGVEFRDVAVSVDDQPNANDLNIGTSILRNFLITTDFRQRSVWLEPVRPTN